MSLDSYISSGENQGNTHMKKNNEDFMYCGWWICHTRNFNSVCCRMFIEIIFSRTFSIFGSIELFLILNFIYYLTQICFIFIQPPQISKLLQWPSILFTGIWMMISTRELQITTESKYSLYHVNIKHWQSWHKPIKKVYFPGKVWIDHSKLAYRN